MKQLYHRIRYFFDLWGSYYYENKIDASFAWELAGIFAGHHEELSSWERLA